MHNHIRTVRPQKVGAAANQAAAKQTEKYSDLSCIYIFYPVVAETAGTWHQQTIELIQEIDRRISDVTGDAEKPVFCFSSSPRHCREGMCGLLPKNIHHHLSCCNHITFYY